MTDLHAKTLNTLLEAVRDHDPAICTEAYSLLVKLGILQQDAGDDEYDTAVDLIKLHAFLEEHVPPDQIPRVREFVCDVIGFNRHPETATPN